LQLPDLLFDLLTPLLNVKEDVVRIEVLLVPCAPQFAKVE